jgi:uncharacterized repeat protein (TIGR01451 family)
MNKFLKRLPKALVGVFALLLVAILGLSSTGAALLGDNRPTKPYTQGVAGFDHVTFNSFTGVPNIGDERNFFTGKIAGAPDGFYDPMNGVRGGDEVLMRVYVHNGADESLNASGAGVARNTRVRVQLPTSAAHNQTAHAFVSADNAQPQIIEDTLTVNGQYPVSLNYVPGSATIKTNFIDQAISDNVVTSGVLIGDDNVNGNMKGCFEFVALVTFKVKVTAPSYTVDKKVRLNGTSTFTDNVTAKPGDKVDFVIAFKNVGTTNLMNVVVGDRLPTGMTYVANSTEWNSGHTGNVWKPSPSNNVTVGGVNIGAYAPGGAAFVRFTATVPSADKLDCGLNKLVNHGYVKPEGQGTIEDTATVEVNKVCEDVPAFACELLKIEKTTGRTVRVADFKTTQSNGATFKNVVINWGDNTTPLTTNNAVGQTHTYAADGTYRIVATATFSVPDQGDKTATSKACEASVTFGSVPPTPTTLPNTGAGDVIGIFASVTAAGAVAHRYFYGRRLEA